MTLDDATDILFDGSDEQLSALRDVEYAFSSDMTGVHINCNGECANMYGDYSDANCISIYGLSHTFPAKATA